MPNLSSLSEYANSVFRPALAAWEKAQPGSEASKRFPAVALVEAYGWISIGVRTAAFPADMAREIVTPSVEAIRAANEMTEREGLLQSGITSENRRLFESKEMFPPSYCDRFKNEFEELPEAPTLFSLWCAESWAFAESGGKFIETLNFAYENDWDTAIGRLKDEHFQPEVDIASEESLFEGYLRSLQHMNRIADLMAVEGTRTAGWPARAIMRVDVGNIHGWQINFQSNVFAPRFDEVTEAVESRLRAEAGADGVHLEKGGFIRGVRNLKLRYRESLGYLSRQSAR